MAQSYQKPDPQVATYKSQLGGAPEGEVLGPASGPDSWDLHWRNDLPHAKCLALKTNRAYCSGGPQVCRGMERFHCLRAQTQTHLTQDQVQKQQFEGAQTIWERDSFCKS